MPKRIMTRFLLTISAIILSLAAQAQLGKFFSADNQLSSSFVTQVYLDNEGFIWVTTRDGINRYDGYQFRVIKRDNDSDNTLAINYVNSILQDSRGVFYFGMYGALQTWDGKQFYQVKMTDAKGNEGQCYATCFLQRANGDVLAGTSGLGVVRFTDKSHAQQMNGGLNDLHTISGMLEDREERLWMITEKKGLISYDGKQVKRYLEDQRNLVLTCLCADRNGIIYVGTTNAGVFRLQGSRFEHIASSGNSNVAALYCDHYGRIIFGYDGKGLAIYDPRTDQLTDNPFFSMEVDLRKSKVYSITEDHSGNLWLGILQKGIYKQPITPQGFGYQGYKMGANNMIGNACVISTLIDRKGRTWIGTDKDGLYVLEKNKVLKHFTDGVPSTVMTLEEDGSGRIWLGSYREGMGYVDPATMQYRQLPYEDDPHLMVMDLVCDSQQRLWIGTLKHGVLCMDLADRSFRRYVMEDGAVDDRKKNSITNNYVSQLSLSPDERRLYVSTSMGLCCLDIRNDSWVKAFGANCLNYGTPVRIAREYSGTLWVGTNNGLFCYDLKGKPLRHYTSSNGLADNGISAIEQDRMKRLWVGTNHGLSCLDTKTGLFRNYFSDDGLQSNEFGDGASCVAADGTILFGGTGGVTWFRPQDIVQRKWEATVKLTSFAINGQPLNRGSYSDGYLVTDTTVIASSRFELGYHDNSFSIEFSTLTFENPEHIAYLYSVNGEPFTRLQPGVNVLTFSHLPPGTYRFRVKAERNHVETPVREFSVVVHSPWYRSAWAMMVYFLAFAAALWYYLTNRRRKEQDRLRLQEHIHAEEMGEAKLRFFMNISHEIRTPMTLIITPLLSLIKNEKDAGKKSVYETIKRNAERILHLINQMMDLRKIDKGQMQMRMQETDLISFVNDIYTLFGHQAKAKRIDLGYEHDTKLLPIWLDRQNFDKVIVNILSNAFKFTPTGGKIRIVLTHDDQHARIAISDNGEKIPEEKLGRIFERFYQASPVANDRNVGTGIGLDLTRSLVELHHGTIEAHNLEQGCEFVVTIPLGNAHLKPEEMLLEKEVVSSGLATTEIDELMMQDEVEPAPADTTRNKGRQLLVIAEDDDEIRDYLEQELGRDYDVRTCQNGVEAMKEILRSVPDLVISDVMMPEMDGNTLCSKLKSNPSTNFIPFVMLTAKNRDEDKLEGLETGADAYIVKPFNMDILRRTVANLISSHQLLRLKYERNDNLEEQIDGVKLKSPDEKLLERVMATINAHLKDSDLSVDMIADEVGISRVHLHRKMKELTGQTPHDFIRNLRLKRAAYLLASPGVNVTDVMYACGFSNSASFSTLFKKFYGVSPREYIKEHGNR